MNLEPNNFNDLPEKPIPEDLKRQVKGQLYGNINVIKHVGEIASIFIGKVSSLIIEIIKKIDAAPQDNKHITNMHFESNRTNIGNAIESPDSEQK